MNINFGNLFPLKEDGTTDWSFLQGGSWADSGPLFGWTDDDGVVHGGFDPRLADDVVQGDDADVVPQDNGGGWFGGGFIMVALVVAAAAYYAGRG